MSGAKAKAKAKPALKSSSVYCRIRPFAPAGGHAATEDADQKTLEKWDDQSVSIATEYMFSKDSKDYTFPKQVLGPETDQSVVFETLMPDFMNAFLGDGAPARSALFLAYGQTGTGKTHTMFGTDASLAVGESSSDTDGWGLFPRVATTVFGRLAGKKFILQGSAVEFYVFACSDLLNAGAQVLIEHDTHMPRGNLQVELKSTEDVLKFIATARANRKARSTKMNVAEGGHEGSSRSHAALILSLLQLDEAGNCLRTSFSLVDLAGAERPGKTGEARVSGFEAMLELLKGRELGVGAQGTIINYELSLIRNAIVAASNAHAKGLGYAPEKSMTTSMMSFISGAFTGSAMLGMVVCLSPSGANGWETWFSLEYGKDMATLKVPLKSEPRDKADKKIEKLEKQMMEAIEALKKTPPSGSPASKYFAGRLGGALYLTQYCLDLSRLCERAELIEKAEAHLVELQGFDRSKFADAMKPACLGDQKK